MTPHLFADAVVSSRRRSRSPKLLPIGDDDLVHLASLTQLESLFLWRTSVGDTGLKHLAALKHLHTLYFGYNDGITDVGLRNHLKNWPKLRSLYLHGTSVTNEGMVELKNLPELVWLSVSHTEVDDRGMSVLNELTALEGLGVA